MKQMGKRYDGKKIDFDHSPLHSMGGRMRKHFKTLLEKGILT